jgi:ketosteroid isomerase-like protein
VSQADIDLIRGGFDTFADDGIDAILQLMDPEIELLTPANPDMQRGTGHDGVRRSLNGLLEMFEYWNVEALEFVDLGENIVVSVCQYARGRGSGVTVESRSAWLFTMRNGKAVRLALHTDKAEAIEAAQNQSLRQ